MLSKLSRQLWPFFVLIFLSPAMSGQETQAPTTSGKVFGNFNAELPRSKFADYPVSHIYQGEPATPVITKGWREYRTMIRRGARSNVEFAGHYTVPVWGCGTSCRISVIVDSISGKIYDVPFAVDGLPFKWTDEHEGDADPIEFHPNSRLLKINACPNEDHCGFYDYVMAEGKGLKLVRRELLPAEFQLPSPGLEDFLSNYPTGSNEHTKTQFFAVTVSLSDDGTFQEIVYLGSEGWCGSGGCTLLILAQKGYSYDYTIISKIVDVRPPVRVLSTITNGWHDLSVGVKGGGSVHAHEARLRFDGKSYPTSPTVPSAPQLSAKIQGEVIVPNSVKLQPLYP